MDGLPYRRNVAAEHSELSSTGAAQTPNSGGHELPSHYQHRTHPKDWNDGTHPPPQDVKQALLRILSVANMSQSSVFSTVAPVLVFLALLTLGVIALQPQSFAHHVLAAPLDHVTDLLKGALVLSCGLGMGLVALRAVIWVGATCLEMSLDSIKRKGSQVTTKSAGDDAPIPASTSGLVLGILQ